MAGMFEDIFATIDDAMLSIGGVDGPYESDRLVTGSGGGIPTVSDEPETSLYTRAQDLLGSVGELARSATRTARDIGTAVGTIEREFDGAGDAYKEARTNARAGNGLGQWWQYASTTDKIMAGLAVVGIAVSIWAVARSGSGK